MPWGAIALAAGTLISSYLSSKSQKSAAKSAANAQTSAANQANAMQRYMYDTNRSDMQPFRDIELRGANIGIDSMEQLQDRTKAGPGDFKASEGYRWTLGQGVNALDKSAVAGGRSRNADTMNYAKGLASTEYDNHLRRYYDSLNPLQSLSRVQTGYQNAMAGAGQNYANQAGANSLYAGDAAAQAALAGGQARAQMWNTMGNIPMNAMSMYNMYNQPQPQQNTGTPQAYNKTWSPRG